MNEFVFIIIMTILGLPLITLIGNYATKIVKARHSGGNSEKLEAQVQQLLKENQDLQKRLFNVETIVLEDKEYYSLPPRNEPKSIAGQLHELAEEKQKKLS